MPMNETPATLPVPRSKVIGAVYLLYFLAAFAAAFLTRGLVIAGDPAATGQAILDHETLYRAGFALGLIGNVLYIAVTALFYRLFATVNRTLSLVAAFVSLVGCTVQICAGVFQLAPLVVLHDPAMSAGLDLREIQAVAQLCLKLYSQSFYISLVLFATYDLLLGFLILKSRFVPRALGIFLIVAGVGWLTFMWPPAALALARIILPIGALAEIALMVWLVVKGVDAAVWQVAESPEVPDAR